MKYIAWACLFLMSINIQSEVLHTQKNQEQKTIIVYGSDTCHYCLDTKTHLKAKKIDFIYYDVDINLAKQREMLVKMQKAGLAVNNLSLPVVDLYGKLIMNGTNFEEFLKTLDTTKTR